MRNSHSSLSQQIQTHLLSLQDLSYKKFHEKLIPGVPTKTIIGIRVPVLRKYAKELFQREPFLPFLQDLPHTYYEENNLHGLLLEQLKDLHQALELTENFLPFIDNWATCDIFSPKVFKKFPDQVYEKILFWLTSDHCYTIRYAIGLLLSNYLDEYFDPKHLEKVAQIRSEEYYVNMMIAWYFSTALVKQYDQALPYLLKGKLDPWTHNKTLQKAVESYRVPQERKDYFKTLKIRK